MASIMIGGRAAHFKAIDGYRGILAVAVMLFHFGLNTMVTKATGGRIVGAEWTLAVDVFFILSGFVLTHAYRSRPETWRAFAIRRVFRLYPLILVTNVVMLIVLLLEHATPSSGVAAANFLLVQSPLGLPSLNVPAWSIPYELYLPVLVLGASILTGIGLSRRSAALAMIVLAGAGMVSIWLLVHGAELALARAVPSLAAGACLYVTVAGRPSWLQVPFLPDATGIVIVLAIALSGTVPAMALLITPLALLFIYSSISCRSLLSLAPFQYLGKLSYAIYLTHIPMLSIATLVIGEMAIKGHGWIKFLLVVSVVVVSHVMLVTVEKPMIAIGRRVADHGRTHI